MCIRDRFRSAFFSVALSIKKYHGIRTVQKRILTCGMKLYGFPDVYKRQVESVDTANNSVRVMISMFGRETSVEFELDQLEKAED